MRKTNLTPKYKMGDDLPSERNPVMKLNLSTSSIELSTVEAKEAFTFGTDAYKKWVPPAPTGGCSLPITSANSTAYLPNA